jgi:hypothetical protein
MMQGDGGELSAEALTLKQLFLKGEFEPARVQQDDQWTDREVLALLRDLERALARAGLDPDPVDSEPPETGDDDEDDREACKTLLGNVCLLPGDLDGRLLHGGFQMKRAAYGQLPTLYRSAHEVAAHADWTPEAVKARTELLARRAIAALAIGG